MKEFKYPCDKTYECKPIKLKLHPGSYLFECYGAQGGTGLSDGSTSKSHPGGKGAYTSGILNINRYLDVYLYIGGMGESPEYKKKDTILGGWNGGGNGMVEILDDDDSAAGGGSTDIRLVQGPWNDTLSLRSRIMVAAGGSGSVFRTYGAPGGDINGYIINALDSQNFGPSETNQKSGYKFGIGQDGKINGDRHATPYSGGGGGYYGGSTRDPLLTNEMSYNAVSSSGSSFVSGHKDCIAITKDGLPSESNVHYSGISFQNPMIVNGFSIFPGFESSSFVEGNEGNGAIRMTILSFFSCTYKKSFIIHSSFLYILILQYS